MRRFFVSLAVLFCSLDGLLGQCLNGNYSVGANGDFSTLTLAITALQNRGVCGPVVMGLKDGTYAEEIVLASIPGSSAANTITFRSESMDEAKVTIQSNSSGNAIKMNGASSFVTFAYMTLFKNASTGTNIVIQNSQFIALDHIIFDAINEFQGEHLSISSFGGPNYTCHNVNVTSCTFRNSSAAVSVSAASYVSLKDNKAFPGLFGFNLFDAINASIEDNSIVSDNQDFTCGIYIQGASQNTKVVRNEVILRDCNSCQAFRSVNGTVAVGTEHLEVSNNIFNVNNGSNSFAAVMLRNSNNVNFYFNTVVLGHGSSATNSANSTIDVDDGLNLELKNNIIVNAGTGLAMRYYRPNFIPSLVSDNNNLYTNGTKLISYMGFLRSNLGEWQQDDYDFNSVSTYPEFYAQENLRVYRADLLENKGASISGITTDIDGDTRTITPDIGADEFEYVPPTVDAALILPTDFSKAYCYGWHPVNVVLKNYGETPITTLKIKTSINGKEYIHSWTGILSVDGAQETVVAAEHYFTDIIHEVVVELIEVNGIADDNSNNNQQNFFLIIKLRPQISVIGKNEICSGETVQLSANTPSALWANGNNNSAIETGQAGQYWFDYTFEGCTARSDSVEVTVNTNLPSVNIAYTVVGQTLQITNKSSNATSYSWDYADGTTGTNTDLDRIHEFKTPGDYEVKVTATNSDCSLQDMQLVTIEDLATLNCILSDIDIKDVLERGDFLYAGGSTFVNPTSAVVYKINKKTFEIVWTWVYDTDDDSDLDDYVKDVEIDADGNVYATLYSRAFYNRLVKLNDKGELIFMKRVSSYSADEIDPGGKAIVKIDRNKNVYFINTRSSFTVEKYTPEGILVWTRNYPNGTFALVRAAIMDTDDGIVVLASESLLLNDMLSLTKINVDGDVVFNHALNQNMDDRSNPYSLFRINDSFYAFGTNNEGKTFVVRANSDGILQWSDILNETVVPLAHAVDKEGNTLFLFLKGDNHECFLRKIQSNGEILFEKKMQYEWETMGYYGSLLVDEANFIYCTINKYIYKYSPSGTLIFSDYNMPLSKSAIVLSDNDILIGGVDYASCSLVRVNQTDHRMPQVITFEEIADEPLLGNEFTLFAQSSSGLPVIFSSSSSAISIAGNSVFVIASGDVDIVATQPGDEDYKPAEPVSQRFTIEQLIDGTEDGTATMKAYPNPTSANLIVEVQENDVELILTNSVGGAIERMRLQHGTNQVDLSMLPSGLYILKMKGKNSERQMKLIKSQ